MTRCVCAFHKVRFLEFISTCFHLFPFLVHYLSINPRQPNIPFSFPIYFLSPPPFFRFSNHVDRSSNFFRFFSPISTGQCGSCWAFGASSALDARLCIATKGVFSGPRAQLSRGFVASCAPPNNGDGCQGGWSAPWRTTIGQWLLDPVGGWL